MTTKHKDVTSRLVSLNPTLARQARAVLDLNKSERHIRGGLATREKYLQQHKMENYWNSAKIWRNFIEEWNLTLQVTLHKKYETFCKKCLTSPCGSGSINKLSQGIASEILKNKLVFRKFKLTVDNWLNL